MKRRKWVTSKRRDGSYGVVEENARLLLSYAQTFASARRQAAILNRAERAYRKKMEGLPPI